MGTKIETSVIMGNTYKDKVSGFVGKAIAVTKWQFGCIRIALRPVVVKDGKLMEEEWFDEESLENIIPKEKTTGGPTPNPKQNIEPKR